MKIKDKGLLFFINCILFLLIMVVTIGILIHMYRQDDKDLVIRDIKKVDCFSINKINNKSTLYQGVENDIDYFYFSIKEHRYKVRVCDAIVKYGKEDKVEVCTARKVGTRNYFKLKCHIDKECKVLRIYTSSPIKDYCDVNNLENVDKYRLND